MGLRKFGTWVTADTALVTTAETVIATLTGISTNQPGQTVAFEGEITMTTGTNSTGVTYRVRADTVAGAVIGEAIADVIEAAVGAVETHTIAVADVTLGEFSGRTFVLTAQQVAASANGSVTQCSLRCEVTP